MRILNFLIFKVFLVFGSEDFKVALVQTPPRRYEVFFILVERFSLGYPGNRDIRSLTIFICQYDLLVDQQGGFPDPWIRAPQEAVLGTLSLKV